MDLALPLQRGDQERVGDGAPGGSGRPEASSSSPARRPASRRSARATGATSPWGETQTWEYDATANGGLGAWSLETLSSSPTTTSAWPRRRRAYCQDGRSYTKNGTLVDLFDTRQIIWPNAIENPFSPSNDGLAVDDGAGVLHLAGPEPANPSLKDSALQRTRYRELSPVGECRNLSLVDRLEHDHIEDGRWASPLTNTPRLQVFSPTYCTHDEYEDGRRAALGLQPVHDAGLQDDAGMLRRRLDAGLDGGLHARRRPTVCQDGRRAVAGRPGVAARSPDRRQVDLSDLPVRAPGRGAARRRRERIQLGGHDLRLGLRSGVGGRVGRRQGLRRRPRETGRRPAGRGAGRSGAGDAAGARGERGVRRAGPVLRAPRVLAARCPTTGPATSSSTRSTKTPRTARTRRRR